MKKKITGLKIISMQLRRPQSDIPHTLYTFFCVLPYYGKCQINDWRYSHDFWKKVISQDVREVSGGPWEKWQLLLSNIQ